MSITQNQIQLIYAVNVQLQDGKKEKKDTEVSGTKCVILYELILPGNHWASNNQITAMPQAS